MPDRPPHRHYDECAGAIRELPSVVSVDQIDTDTRHGGRPTVEVVLSTDLVRVPPRVLRTVVEYDLGIADVTPQGGFLTIVAT